MGCKVDILIAVAQRGGVENIIKLMIPYLRKNRDWEIRVVQLVWEGDKWTDEETAFYPLLEGRKGHHLEEFVSVYAEFLKENGSPDIVLATAWPYMCYVAKKANNMVGTPDTKVVSWLHAPVERYEAAGFGGYAYLALADAHLAISQLIAGSIASRLPGAKVLFVKNPVDFSKCRLVKSEHVSCKTEVKKLYFVGRLSEEKRLDLIIRAMQGLSGMWELHIVGDSEKAAFTQKLKRLAEECQVSEDICWLGWQENPWECAGEADALILASEYEGFPLAAIEALANGIPVIATPVSGITELIRPGVNGYIFPSGDWQMLHQILRMIATNQFPAIDPEVCKQSVAEHAPEHALADFSVKVESVLDATI